MAGDTSMQGKAGYKKGTGRTFTPSLKADWVDDFNRVLEKEPGWSRNQLTEYYIRKGMEESNAGDRSTITVNHDDLTEDQVAFLQSEEGRTFIGNVISYVLAGTGKERANAPKSAPSPPPIHHERQDDGPPKEKEKEVEAEERPKEEQKNEEYQSDSEVQSSSRHLSVLEKAQQKLNRQNL
ncbi:hypothetical protein [Salibacterium aidingense]|uniref:hypothetical protein n=1 Tax=Salibacterium aidingense TaxID=384933 RepID=UPI00047AEE3C|nr:hypothetical protein [Salibacterium aidingense]